MNSLTTHYRRSQLIALPVSAAGRKFQSAACAAIVEQLRRLTAKGCMFGKNITSPANPRETQPHFFESRFPELLKLLDTVH